MHIIDINHLLDLIHLHTGHLKGHLKFGRILD
jgi:hypothetical protein